jgi:hypothetical protein
MAALSPTDDCACIIMMFRAFVNDLDTPPTYTDARITQLVNAAAFFVNSEVGNCNAISKPSINFCTEDACAELTSYPAFANLVVLKALCMLDQGLARSRFSSEGVKAVCGPASLQVMGGTSSSLSLLIKFGPCQAYQELKDNLCFKQPLESSAACAQILGPFTSDGFDPVNSRSNYKCR